LAIFAVRAHGSYWPEADINDAAFDVAIGGQVDKLSKPENDRF